MKDFNKGRLYERQDERYSFNHKSILHTGEPFRPDLVRGEGFTDLEGKLIFGGMHYECQDFVDIDNEVFLYGQHDRWGIWSYWREDGSKAFGEFDGFTSGPWQLHNINGVTLSLAKKELKACVDNEANLFHRDGYGKRTNVINLFPEGKDSKVPKEELLAKLEAYKDKTVVVMCDKFGNFHYYGGPHLDHKNILPDDKRTPKLPHQDLVEHLMAFKDEPDGLWNIYDFDGNKLFGNNHIDVLRYVYGIDKHYLEVHMGGSNSNVRFYSREGVVYNSERDIKRTSSIIDKISHLDIKQEFQLLYGYIIEFADIHSDDTAMKISTAFNNSIKRILGRYQHDKDKQKDEILEMFSTLRKKVEDNPGEFLAKMGWAM